MRAGRRCRRGLAAVAILCLGAIGAVAAQEPAQVTQFAAEPAARPEAVARGFRFLIGAYTVVWTILALYLLSLSVRLRSLSGQVRRLRERLGEKPVA